MLMTSLFGMCIVIVEANANPRGATFGEESLNDGPARAGIVKKVERLDHLIAIYASQLRRQSPWFDFHKFERRHWPL